MITRCPCGIVLLWPRNVCSMCGTPTTPEQRLRATPQPLTAKELDALEVDVQRINGGSKSYTPELVTRLLVTIRVEQRRKRAAQVGLFT